MGEEESLRAYAAGFLLTLPFVFNKDLALTFQPHISCVRHGWDTKLEGESD